MQVTTIGLDLAKNVFQVHGGSVFSERQQPGSCVRTTNSTFIASPLSSQAYQTGWASRDIALRTRSLAKATRSIPCGSCCE